MRRPPDRQTHTSIRRNDLILGKVAHFNAYQAETCFRQDGARAAA
jgi:hypothetical protein